MVGARSARACVDRSGDRRVVLQLASGGFSQGVPCDWLNETTFRLGRLANGDGFLEFNGASETVPHALLAPSARPEAEFALGCFSVFCACTAEFGPIGMPISLPAFLHGSGSHTNPRVLFLDDEAPTGSTAKHKDSGRIKFGGGNPWRPVGTWTIDPALTSGTLTALGDLHVWLGLKNSDDAGTRFDVAAEVWKNDALVAEGETFCITGVRRNPNLAKEVSVPFAPFAPVDFDGATDQLSLRILTRIGTNGAGAMCGGHRNAVGLRVYFDSAERPSQLDATFS